MLQVSNISKSYGGQILFDDVSFTISRGERVGLVGRNGHGKSTLFRLILGEEAPDTGTITTPKYYTIGHLSQHIQFSNGTVLAEGAIGLPPGDQDAIYKVEKILLGLGFSVGDFNRPPDHLSGGFQVRLQLAKVLVSAPNLLLLDEPTNYLDIVSIRWLIHFLSSWRNELIVITHDRGFMDQVTTHTMGIHRCNVRKVPGSTQKYYTLLDQDETVYERTRLNEEKKRKEVTEYINQFRAKATKARSVQSKIKMLNRMDQKEALEDIRDLDFRFSARPFRGKSLIEVHNLSFGFEDDHPLFTDLNFKIGPRDRLAIVGKNGSGKTTLLNILVGDLIAPNANVIRHPQLALAYFGQTNIDRLDPSLTIEQAILSVEPDGNRRRARSIAGKMMFPGDLALKKISVLSGGEKSRVLLGKLLVDPASLLVLDEPTNHLDIHSVDALLKAMVTFDGAVVIVTHNEMILRRFATQLIVFDNGNTTFFNGGYDQFLDQVGWADEKDARTASAPPPKSTPATKKEQRKARSQLIAQRSKALSPLKKEIHITETKINHLEGKLNQLNYLMLDAVTQNRVDEITQLSKSIAATEKMIKNRYHDLEAATDKYDQLAAKFDNALIRITQQGG